MPTHWTEPFELFISRRDTNITSVVNQISDRMADKVFDECRRILMDNHTAWRGHNSMSSSIRGEDQDAVFDWMAHINEIKIGDPLTFTIDSASATNIKKIFGDNWSPQYMYGQFFHDMNASVVNIPDDTIMTEIDEMLNGL